MIYITDMVSEIEIAESLTIQGLVRFVILQNYEEIDLSPKMIATLEVFSMRCGLSIGFAEDVNDLETNKYFPILLCETEDYEKVAMDMAMEKRTQKDVEIAISSNVVLKVSYLKFFCLKFR